MTHLIVLLIVAIRVLLMRLSELRRQQIVSRSRAFFFHIFKFLFHLRYVFLELFRLITEGICFFENFRDIADDLLCGLLQRAIYLLHKQLKLIDQIGSIGLLVGGRLDDTERPVDPKDRIERFLRESLKILYIKSKQEKSRQLSS